MLPLLPGKILCHLKSQRQLSRSWLAGAEKGADALGPLPYCYLARGSHCRSAPLAGVLGWPYKGQKPTILACGDQASARGEEEPMLIAEG